MKSSWVFVFIIAAISLLHAFKSYKSSGIKGKVTPHDAVSSILAIHENDSIKIVPSKGVFNIKSKPGVYKIFMATREPYKDSLMEAVLVSDNNTTDLGEINIRRTSHTSVQ
jgi:hypothetical protein